VCHSVIEGNAEGHHVVPRAYGGSQGPVVNLCDSCHTKVHKLAHLLEKGKTDTFGLDSEAFSRLNYLASVVVRAKSLMREDPNKRVKVTLTLTVKEANRLDIIKERYRLGSREDVLKYLLNKCAL
jgi:hypothetical protein